jgi:ectoine hydroxylase-related dioxygenase (phytanoyl-CoA dioxygenase family)
VSTHTEGDGRSWWATVADGGRRVVRMQGFDERSPAAAALLADTRIDRIGAIAKAELERRTGTENRIEALYKPIGVRDGISDVPWHKDCSLGRHSYECCALTIGISVTAAGPGCGQLRVVPGSHRALVWPSLLDPAALGLNDVALPTAAGDVTVHLSCTLHRAEPPTERERKVMYTNLRLVPSDRAAANAGRRRMVADAREQAPMAKPAPTPH